MEMIGWDWGDIIQHTLMWTCLIIIGLAGCRDSVVFRLLFRKGAPPEEKTLKLLRRLSVIGLIITITCAIASRVLYLTQGR